MNLSSACKLIAGTLLAASTLAASATPINVLLKNAGDPSNVVAGSVTVNGKTLNNVFIGPYTLTVNGVDMAAMCINFDIASQVGDSYKANETMVGSSDLSNTYASKDPLAGQKYQEEAYLFSKLVAPNADRTAIQIAAWDIMSYGITDSSYTKTFGISDNSYIDAALANYSTINNAGFAIISDVVKGGEQEFIVDPPVAATPEPSSLALMLLPALLGAEMVRRQRFASNLS